jgi:ferric-dicitrate binding protein FerR (iron transport regulator)
MDGGLVSVSDSKITLAEITARARASEWLAVLRRPERTPEIEAQFRAWLAADSSNRRAFDAATGIWERLGPAGQAIRAQKRRRKTAAMTAAAACLVVAVGVGAGVVSQTLKRRKLSAA